MSHMSIRAMLYLIEIRFIINKLLTWEIFSHHSPQVVITSLDMSSIKIGGSIVTSKQKSVHTNDLHNLLLSNKHPLELIRN